MSRLIESSLAGKISRMLIEEQNKPANESLKESSLKEDGEYKTYDVVVNWNGFIGCENEYNIGARSREDAVYHAIDEPGAEAEQDLSVENIEDLGDGEYEVTVGWCGFVGCEETYTVYADDEEDAEIQAIEEAKSGLEVVSVDGEEFTYECTKVKKGKKKLQEGYDEAVKIADFLISYDPYEFRNSYEGVDDFDKKGKLVTDILKDKNAAKAYIEDIIQNNEGTEDQLAEAKEILKLFEGTGNKKEIEDRIGELKQAIQDGVSKDEKKAMEKEIAELEKKLNESDGGRYHILRKLQNLFDELDNIDYGDREDTERYGNMEPGLADQDRIAAQIKELVQDNNITKSEFDEVFEPYHYGIDISYSDFAHEPKHASKEDKEKYMNEEDKPLKEDSYEEGIFKEIEDALVDAGFSVDRYIDTGVLTRNIGWEVSKNGEYTQLDCPGSYYEEDEEDFDESSLNEDLEDHIKVSIGKENRYFKPDDPNLEMMQKAKEKLNGLEDKVSMISLFEDRLVVDFDNTGTGGYSSIKATFDRSGDIVELSTSAAYIDKAFLDMATELYNRAGKLKESSLKEAHELPVEDGKFTECVFDQADADYFQNLVGPGITVKLESRGETENSYLTFTLDNKWISGFTSTTKELDNAIKEYFTKNCPEFEVHQNNTGTTLWLSKRLKESVTVVTSDGSSVDTSNSASVQSEDGTVTVTTNDATVVINNAPESPVEDIPIEEPLDEPEELPMEEPATEEPLEEPEELSAESTEDEVIEEADENSINANVDAKSLAVIKNQGSTYMLQIEESNGKTSYWVVENFNQETNEGDDAEVYDNKEDADKEYFSRVGVETTPEE